MSKTETFHYNEIEENRFTSHATYTNGRLKRYDAFNAFGEKVNIFDGYTPVLTQDGKFDGYQDQQGRKIEVKFGDTIYVGSIDKNGEMDDTRKSFYSVSYYLSLLEKKRERTR